MKKLVLRQDALLERCDEIGIRSGWQLAKRIGVAHSSVQRVMDGRTSLGVHLMAHLLAPETGIVRIDEAPRFFEIVDDEELVERAA